jgi:SNF2 family DNA or RNA helicase
VDIYIYICASFYSRNNTIYIVPVKHEHVVFCKLAPLQEDLYNVFLTSPETKRLLRGQGSQPLKVKSKYILLIYSSSSYTIIGSGHYFIKEIM